jgi:hypothetical protein
VAGFCGLGKSPGQAFVGQAVHILHRIFDLAARAPAGFQLGQLFGQAKGGEVVVLPVADRGCDGDMGTREDGVKGRGCRLGDTGVQVGHVGPGKNHLAQRVVIVAGKVQPFQCGLEAVDQGRVQDQGGKDDRLAQGFLDRALGLREKRGAGGCQRAPPGGANLPRPGARGRAGTGGPARCRTTPDAGASSLRRSGS